jgi:uncharacterized repeat protein (TIGR01451 family)
MRSLFKTLLVLSVFVLQGCYSGTNWDPSLQNLSRRDEIASEEVRWDKDLRPILVSPREASVAPTSTKEPAYVKPHLTSTPMPSYHRVLEQPVTVRQGHEVGGESDFHTVSMIYPNAAFGILQLDKTMPKEVELEATFNYLIKVSNLTKMAMNDITIVEELPYNFKFTSANPAGIREENKLIWEIDSLGSKASKEIIVTGIPSTMEVMRHRTIVTHAIESQANVRVVLPKLGLAVNAPSEVLLCEAIPVEFVVTNSGTGSAKDVKIISRLPAGLQTVNGEIEIVLNVDAVRSGQSRRFVTQLRASKTGVYINKAVARSSSGQTAESETSITVRQPVLTIAKTGPDQQYVGRPVSYDIAVTNIGDGVAKNTVLEDTIPSGVTSIEATEGAKFSASKLVWQLGTLMPNNTKNIHVSYTPTVIGKLDDITTAVAYCAERVTHSAQTVIMGIAAVQLEVVDLEDPVQVGSETTYLITVVNKGSAPDTNIRIICSLEDKVRYMSSSGATSSSIMGQTVSFAPLNSLAPKAEATWRVVVRGIRPGDVRFKVTMHSDRLARPVEESEDTHLY